ncbi:MAG TPA: PilZ domain-containing protein, partial [Thermoanaerobaculia bacterium]|nr:PilZ domain-containing protein [Thermoanaerobaculia bacterium]
TTSAPQPPGSVLDFQFQLGDGYDLIRGKGEVVWIRAVAEGPGRPAGIGIRFLDLAEGSKELIYRIVDQYIQDGGTPFDVSLRPPDPVQPEPMPEPAPFPDLPDTGTFQAVDSSTWLPSASGLNASRADEELSPFMPLPPFEEPEPPRPTLSFAGMAASAHTPRQNRALPLTIVGLILALAAAGFVFRGNLLSMAGFGGDPAAASPAPQGPSARPQAPPPQETESVTPITEEDSATPLPEVVRRKEPEEAPAVAAPPSGPALTAVEKITWEPASGGTDLILWGNGAIRPEVYDQSHIGDPPRELIRLTGISRPFPSPRLPVGTAEVKQVRIGYHTKAGGNELHIVIDLADPAVKVTRIEARERHLRIHLQRQ